MEVEFMSWDALEAKKGMRITNMIVDIAIAGISIILAFALWLTLDYVLYMYGTMAPSFPSMPGLQGLFIGIMITQMAGGTLIIFRAVSRIIGTIIKEGRP